MSCRKKDRQSIYLITTPAEFRPQRPWDTPPSFVTAELYVANVGLFDAVGFARVHNCNQLRRLQANNGQWDRHWAVVIRHLKPCRPSRSPLMPTAADSSDPQAAAPPPEVGQ